MTTPLATPETIATVARATRVLREAAEAMEHLLEVLNRRDERIARFRENSAARVVAEVLLAYPGQWLAKDALAAAAQVSPTSVPRVVATLTRSGVRVERKLDASRRAQYRVRGDSDAT